MMEDDLISCLTRQVQEEVIENYLNERKLIDLQLEELGELGQKTYKKALKTGKRFTRIGYLLVDDAFRKEWSDLVRLGKDSFWFRCLTDEFKNDVRFIRVTALTHKGKFKKLFHEAYRRLLARVKEYKEAYENLKKECDAVNLNIKKFHSNYDLLTILQFLKSMDVCGIERKKFLGENFSPDELMSVDEKLYFKPVKFEKWSLPEPPELPPHPLIERRLDDLANQVYERYGNQLKSVIY
ncbi:hypothetical protein [Thermodesulforhabdus norvegica]|uniref:Uncharacterized protein n=1 Tax=Thermodesulforhabdus norvegica TaxID=39841 RepID=A0A1I4R785_9BACT|nr:hypothetical protein [Thermodesulforhabdus norvegica]SFM48069.1 hypothetical protein SAMN05660836_00441 [Thermodesulforhabdus norvegica]